MHQYFILGAHFFFIFNNEQLRVSNKLNCEIFLIHELSKISSWLQSNILLILLNGKKFKFMFFNLYCIIVNKMFCL